MESVPVVVGKQEELGSRGIRAKERRIGSMEAI
jgi:hypothetical protein